MPYADKAKKAQHARQRRQAEAAQKAAAVLAADKAEHELLDRVQAAAPGHQGGVNKGKVTHSQTDPFKGHVRHEKVVTTRNGKRLGRPPGSVSRPRTMPGSVDPNSFAGRIDARLIEMGKGRADLEAHLGVAKGLIAKLARGAQKGFRSAATTKKLCEYLGKSMDELNAPGPITKHNPTGARNGAVMAAPVAQAHDKAAASLSHNLDAALASLMTMVPPDVKAMVLARVAELIAKNARGVP